jgi:diguanylate cyclase (GGDEF)-like protein
MNKATEKSSFGHRLRDLLVSAMSEDLPQERRRQYDSGRAEQYLANSRKIAYRYALMAIAVILAPIQAYNLYTEQYLPAFAGLAVLLLFVTNIYLLVRERPPFLSPPTVLLLTLALVVTSLLYGQSYNLYWIYPLLVALPVLLRTRVSVWLGLLVGVIVLPFVVMRFDTSTAVVVCLSMAHTWMISAWLMYAVSQHSEQLNQLAITDPLTGAYNRRHLQAEAKRALQIYRRYDVPSTLLLIDVDLFKQVNDECGVDAGDEALCQIVNLVQDRLRSEDRVFRYTGEEFVAILKETDESRAMHVAEQIRSFVEQAELLPGQAITISIGVCDVLQAESVDHWLNQCDRALYQAKAEGRNRVVIATPGALLENQFSPA